MCKTFLPECENGEIHFVLQEKGARVGAWAKEYKLNLMERKTIRTHLQNSFS